MAASTATHPKTVQEQKTECCRPQTVQWSTLRPVWTAEYLKDTDTWSVNMEFGIEDAKKSLNWFVDDKSGTVTERN